MPERFDVYESKTRWTLGGELVREWAIRSFGPIAAVSEPIRDGMVREVDPSPAPAFRVVVPSGSKLVGSMGEQYMQFGRSRQCFSAGIVADEAVAGRFGLSVEREGGR